MKNKIQTLTLKQLKVGDKFYSPFDTPEFGREPIEYEVVSLPDKNTGQVNIGINEGKYITYWSPEAEIYIC